MDYKIIKDGNKTYLETSLADFELLRHPLLNKGMSFTDKERQDFNLYGFLPPHESNIDEQRERSYNALMSKDSLLEKYLYMRDLQDSNEVLFYNLIVNHFTETMPIIYTPTVGLGCQKLSHIYRRPRGVFIAYPYRDRIDAILSNPVFNATKVIVVSDGERILGLGDQGAGGMGIPIGKLALYSACAGIHPAVTLPILLDTGTDNKDLIDDPLYIGWRHPRVRGKDYDDFIDRFVTAVKKRFPNILLQWEDFAQRNANPILERYRDELCTFNDDIQGTAAVAVGTLLAAMHAANGKITEQKIVIVGAGSAGCGIANLMSKLMMQDGLSEQAALSRFYMVDKNGLLVEGVADVQSFQQKFVQSKSAIAHWQCENPNFISLGDVVKNLHPTVLIGVSAQANIFTEEVIRDMAAHTQRPIIFPLSNPESHCEASPSHLMLWTEGRALIGTGSPFPDIEKNGRLFRIDQTNNCYIFPGVGLGLIAVKAKRVTQKMFMAAAKALADCSPAKINPDGNLLPPLMNIRMVSLRVAVAVAKEAIASSLTDFDPQIDIEQYIHSYMWPPHYLPYKRC